MTRKRFSTLEPPRFESLDGLTIVGLQKSFTGETWKQIPELWQLFAPWIGKVPQQVDARTYGVMWDESEGGGFHYLAGVEIPGEAPTPEGLQRVDLQPQTYAIFTHRAHISELFKTTCLIYQEWLPKADVVLANTEWFERYSEEFDPATGLGLIEILIPIEMEE